MTAPNLSWRLALAATCFCLAVFVASAVAYWVGWHSGTAGVAAGIDTSVLIISGTWLTVAEADRCGCAGDDASGDAPEVPR
ncbi:MAG TPA: hypothetical protein VFQ68_19180 [Streptosporangiaceae bacterium]|nr:hypothetical protein [Streptosporangiaceae bacterium]